VSEIVARSGGEACPRCGTQVTAAVLSCPSCGALVHAARLKELAATAEAATAREDLSGALAAWREALDLLPAGTKQRDSISGRVTALSARVEKAALPGVANAPAADHKSIIAKSVTGIGAITVLLLKFKGVVLLLLTKGKLLLLGLGKGSTLLSMLLSLGVYWTAFGWRFALGLVLSIYVHEMGHISMLRRYGIKSTAPMFIPGFGALIRLHQYPQDPREDARVGLAGPTWGLGAALIAWGVYLVSGWESWAAIARVAAWINLFNLIPVWQLDGSRGFASLVRPHRWIAAGAIALAWFLSHESLLVLLLIAAVARAFGSKLPERADPEILAQYAALVLVLGWMTTIPVAVG
jgi:Zn-dependent protease